MTSVWTDKQVASLASSNSLPAAPLITADHAKPVIPGLLLWDMWPVQSPSGHVPHIAGGDLWMALAAPDRGDPALRHFEAKIRLLHRVGMEWRDLGDCLPDFDDLYEREWAGSAVLINDTVTLYFTGAGLRSKPGGYQQKLFESSGTLQADGSILNWTVPAESVASRGHHYVRVDQSTGEPGKIKAFRDPSYFRDPATGSEYLVFTASLASSNSDYNGAIGLARKAESGEWGLLPPLVHADGLNNELERAHIVTYHGLYYVFWSTQRSVFNPDGPVGPTGLYGMVSSKLEGPYTPLNVSGLVVANPPEEPMQTYSWYVTADLEVVSFVDHWGLNGRSLDDNPELAAATFGGVPAPLLTIALDGEKSVITGHRALAA